MEGESVVEVRSKGKRTEEKDTKRLLYRQLELYSWLYSTMSLGVYTGLYLPTGLFTRVHKYSRVLAAVLGIRGTKGERGERGEEKGNNSQCISAPGYSHDVHIYSKAPVSTR